MHASERQPKNPHAEVERNAVLVAANAIRGRVAGTTAARVQRQGCYGILNKGVRKAVMFGKEEGAEQVAGGASYGVRRRGIKAQTHAAAAQRAQVIAEAVANKNA